MRRHAFVLLPAEGFLHPDVPIVARLPLDENRA